MCGCYGSLRLAATGAQNPIPKRYRRKSALSVEIAIIARVIITAMMRLKRIFFILYPVLVCCGVCR